jgi:uncharacterized protein (DUF433 family)
MRNNLIQSDPSVMMGKPVIAGTRITIDSEAANRYPSL